MSGYIKDLHNNLFDPVTKKFAGVIGPNGEEQLTSSSSLSAPVAFTSRALTSADAGVTLVCSSAQAATVPAGLGSGFGCAIRGTVTVTAGSGATVNDVRTTGATSPYCALVQIGTDVYDVVGGKA
jgi:hypothetical protein